MLRIDGAHRLLQAMVFNFMLALGVVGVIELGDAIIFLVSAAVGAGAVFALHRRWSRD